MSPEFMSYLISISANLKLIISLIIATLGALFFLIILEYFNQLDIDDFACKKYLKIAKILAIPVIILFLAYAFIPESKIAESLNKIGAAVEMASSKIDLEWIKEILPTKKGNL